MGLLKLKEKISVEDYLEGEKVSPVKHEYISGEVYAMAGASANHNRISGNFFTPLHFHLRGSDCEAFMSDMKVMIDENTFYYPDVVVACDSTDTDPYVRTEPRLIIEVLWPSTQRIDRHEKLSAYRRVNSLQEYVIVAQDRIRVELHRRVSDDDWETQIFNNADEHVQLSSVDLTLSVSDIYRNVRFEEAES